MGPQQNYGNGRRYSPLLAPQEMGGGVDEGGIEDVQGSQIGVYEKDLHHFLTQTLGFCGEGMIRPQ